MPSDWLSCAGSTTQTETGTTTETTQATEPTTDPTASKGNNWSSLIIMFAIMIVFVVIMIVPQKRKEKKQRQMLDAIKPGDELRTIGGIYGKVKLVKEDLVTIMTGPNDDTITFSKAAVEYVVDKEIQKRMEELDKDDEEDTKKTKKSIFSRKK